MDELDAYAARHDRADARRERGIGDKTRVVLCMGTVEPRKAQVMLAHAFAGVDAPDAVLVIVGARTGHYVEALAEYVDQADLGTRVRIEPIVKDTYGWYRAADLFVCASDVESLPRSILEVMAIGVPVLSTDVFGVPELIDDGVTGFLCASRDAAALRDRMSEVLALDEAELRRVGAAGAELVRRVHDPETYADVYEGLLRDSAQAPATGPRSSR